MPSSEYERQESRPMPAELQHLGLDPERHVWIIDHSRVEYVVMLRQFRVYMLTCRPTGERYIGVTEKRVADRLADHAFNAFHKTRRYRSSIQRAIADHGVESFDMETLGIVATKSDACELEINMIDKYGTLVEEGGLNGNRGGSGFRNASPVYHYLDLYERGQANVVHRISRILKGKAKKLSQEGAGAACVLRVVGNDPACASASDDDWMAEFPPVDGLDWEAELL
jgi:hypothetical protein